MSNSFRFLAENTKGTPKLTIPAPMQMHYFVGGRAGIDTKAYPDMADLFPGGCSDGNRSRKSLKLAEAGWKYLTYDVSLAFLCDPRAPGRGQGLGP